jgi:hypothetical protein
LILRKLAIGIILAAIVVALIVASRIVFFDRPAASPDKLVESASAQKRGGVLRVSNTTNERSTARDCFAALAMTTVAKLPSMFEPDIRQILADVMARRDVPAL